MFADLAGGTDVVGNGPIVLADALYPAADVMEDPLLVLLVAGVEVGVGHQRRGAEIARFVALQRHLVEEVEDFLATSFVLIPPWFELLDLRVEEVRRQRLGTRVVLERVAMAKIAQRAAIEPVAHQVDVIRDAPSSVDNAFVLAHGRHRAGTAVEWRAEDAVPGVEVGRVGVLADVHGGELAGALAVGRIGRIGDAEVVEHLIALAHVEPVGVEGDAEVPVLVAQLRHVHGMPRLVVGQLALFAVEPGDRIPFPLGDMEEALVAT